MKSYGIINFGQGGKESADAQKFMLEQLNSLGIITISEKDILEGYERDLKSLGGATCNFVLHNDYERYKFRKLMHAPELNKPWIKWRTASRLKKDSEFRIWLEERGAYEDGKIHGKL